MGWGEVREKWWKLVRGEIKGKREEGKGGGVEREGERKGEEKRLLGRSYGFWLRNIVR